MYVPIIPDTGIHDATFPVGAPCATEPVADLAVGVLSQFQNILSDFATFST